MDFFKLASWQGVGDGEFDVDDDPLGSLGTPLVGLDRFKRLLYSSYVVFS